MADIKRVLKRNKLIARLAAKRVTLRAEREKKRRREEVRRDPLKAHMALYARHFGKAPNLEDPKDFNEKSMWLVHYYYKDDPVVTRCVDKYEMRGYLEEKGYGHLLPKVYGVWDDARKIDWDQLPNEFVLKCNHGSGCNIFCRDKASLDRREAVRKINQWLKINFVYVYGEVNYEHVKPVVYCEEYLDDGNTQPTDYKILCFHGEPKMFMLCTERDKNATFSYADMDYRPLNWETQYHHRKAPLPPKPTHYEELLQYAREISAPFPFVRVDFYDVHGKLYLGEMTFSPLGCADDNISDEGLLQMGEWLDLSEEMARRGRKN